MKLSVLLLSATILSAASGNLSGSWQRNETALETMGACFYGLPANSYTELFEKKDLIWFAAAQAKCTADTEREKLALMQVLASSEPRVNAVRAMMPEDMELATLAAEIHPTSSQAQFWYGNLLAANGNTAEAILAYEQGLKYKLPDGVAWALLGRLYEELGDWRAALQAYDRGCFYFDRGGNGCPNAGRIYLERGYYELAADRYHKSLQQIPIFYGPSEHGLAVALVALDRSGEAVPHLQALADRGDERAVKMLEQLAVIGDQ